MKLEQDQAYTACFDHIEASAWTSLYIICLLLNRFGIEQCPCVQGIFFSNLKGILIEFF
jgi:hypothetical protein